MRFTLRMSDGTITFRNSQKMIERKDSLTGEQWVNIFYKDILEIYTIDSTSIDEVVAVALEWIDK